MFAPKTPSKRVKFENSSTQFIATWGILGFVTAACAVLIGFETLRVVNQRSELLADARKDTANLTSSLIQHAELTFRTADAILIGLVERLEHEPLGPEERQRLKTWFLQEIRHSSQFISFGVIDRDGTMVVSTAGETEPGQFSDREYFNYHRTHEDDAIHIGNPISRRAAEQGWIIPVTRRFNGPDGSFGGVAVAAIDPNYFQDIYDRLQLGNNGAVLLASLNGKLLVRRPFVEANVGRDLSLGGLFAQLKNAPAGTIEIAASIDGVRRLNSYDRGHTYPIMVAVAQNMDELLAPWKQSAMRRMAEVGAIVAFIVLMGGFVWRATIGLAANSIELRETNARFDAALANMSNGLSMFDADGRLVVWNERYIELYGMSHEVVRRGASINSIVAHRRQVGNLDGEVETYVGEFRQTLMDVGRSTSTTHLKDGRVVSVTNTAIAGGGWVAIHEDITERRRAEAEIVHLARYDALTGLANRAEFNAKLSEASKRLKRGGSTISVMMLDLDKFKAVNDTLGHPAGDQLLVEVARRLQSTIRETDVLARLGGDEFGILQEGGSAQHEAAIALALRIINAISFPFDLDGHEASVGTSVGIAMAPENGVEPEDLLKSADLALYDVKANGRNDFRIYHARMLEIARSQQSAESELRVAIAREEFELHYQPVVDVKTRQLCGAEALVRWRHPTKGLIASDRFIPLAESTGLIVTLGEWTLQRACADAASWPSHLKLAVNIPPLQFKRGNLFDVILCTLVETGLAADRLELEITESSLLENQEAHLATIRQLKNLGISMVLDDFGTGNSSLTYPTKFPFDKIRIARTLTEGVPRRRDCVAVVASTIALARGLGTLTTVEGIESEEQLEYVRHAGVDFAQGSLFGQPSPDSQFDPTGATSSREKVA